MSRTIVLAALVAQAAPAAAQVDADRRYAEEPTGGMNLPLAPLTGAFDARAIATNPAGLAFADRGESILALDLIDDAHASTVGPGVGSFSTLFGGLGVALEYLLPPRADLAPDPGTPVRFSLGWGFPLLRRDLAMGVAWRHYFDDGITDGLDTFDIGLAWRSGNHLSAGAVVRDVRAPDVGGTPVQRRYELEVGLRPTGTDVVDLGVGGRIGETRTDIDGWARLSARVARGVYVHAGFETRQLMILETTGTGMRELDGRDARVTLGMELSFGRTGVAAYGAGVRDEDGNSHPLGGTLVFRWSPRGGPKSVLGPRERIERIELSGGLSSREVVSVVARLRAVIRDPGARAVVVTLDGAAGGWASLQEIRTELLRVRAAGKKVFAYMVAGSGRDYYVASAADKIYVDPAGGIRLVGMAGTVLFYRGAFDLVGVEPQFEKIAEFKSAPESYTRSGPTEPAARMRNELYDSMWQQVVAAIAEGRKLDHATVLDLIDNGPYTAGDLARDKRLVDAVANPEKVAELVAVELGGLPVVAPATPERPDRFDLPTIAVIYAEGDIVDGKSQTIPILGRKLVGGETIAAAIVAARSDRSVDGIILRIDSPGGSALASEMMAREVFRTRGVKPIVCSLGDVAASGGYFLAAGCDLIYAEPMTITGSIGIFYGKFDVSGLLAKLGVVSDTYKRGDRADMESFYRPYTDEERAVLREKLEYLYGRFVGAVAEGRTMSKREVDDVGRGHVWSGAQARPIGLVDRFGGFGDVLDEVKRQLHLSRDDRVRLIHLPKDSRGLLGRLIGGLIRSDPSPSLADLPAARALIDAIPPSLFADPRAPQARLPFDVIDE